MSDGAIVAIAGAVAGIAEAFRRVHAAGEQRVQRLGSNLGPRVQELLGRVAYMEGKLGIPPGPKSGKMEGGPDAEHDGR